MAETFQLEIVTPEKKVVDTAAEEVQIPAKNGYLGVLPGHAPLITELSVGEITYRENATEQKLAVAWGFAEVLPNKVTILAETAERPSEINIERARKAKERAEQRLDVFLRQVNVMRGDLDEKRLMFLSFERGGDSGHDPVHSPPIYRTLGAVDVGCAIA